VDLAPQAGHEVTLFNRGKTNPGLFPNLAKIRGDRPTNNEGGISALSGRRRWDAVIDLYGRRNPAVVMPVARLLAARTDFYSFVYSIGVYAAFRSVAIFSSTTYTQS
jgi:2'-hydroxyisoflavone reductase